jgi:putative hydrolase of the HAD superfamily
MVDGIMANDSYILWDFDGTLGHRTGMWSGALLEVLHSHGLAGSLTIDQFRPFVVSGFRWHNATVVHRRCSPAEWWGELEPLFERAFREAGGLPQSQASQLAREVRGRYTLGTQWQLFPDVHAALATLAAAGWRHVLLTNHVPELRAILQSLGVESHFASVFNSADTGVEKPHREAFENVRRSLPRVSRIWMIGDNFPADIQGAEDAGIPAILVRRPHPSAARFAETLEGVAPLLSG